MEEWKEYKVAEVIEDISMGPFGSNIKRDNYVDSGVPYLNGSNLSSYKLNEDSFYYVTEEKAKSLGRCVAKRGDIIVTHRGTIGQISYIPYNSRYEHYLTGNSQFRLTVNSKVIRPDFFVYYFHTKMGQHRLLANASQVGVPALARPTSTFKEVLVPVPKMEIGDIIVPKRGKGLLTKNAIEGNIPVVAGGIRPATYHNTANTEAPVVTIAASGANAGYVNLWHIPVWCSDSSYIDSSMTPDVYFWYVLLKKRQKEIFDAQVGSAQPHIYPKHIAEMPLGNFSKADVLKFTETVKPMFELIGIYKEENIRLANLRDVLLPLLMSGKLEVK